MAVASVRSRAAGAVAVVDLDWAGCVADAEAMADEVDEAETAKAAKAVAALVVGLAKGVHAAKGWAVEATEVGEEKGMVAETVVTAEVVAVAAVVAVVASGLVMVEPVGLGAPVREAEVVAEGMAEAEAGVGTTHHPAPHNS